MLSLDIGMRHRTLRKTEKGVAEVDVEMLETHDWLLVVLEKTKD